MANENIYAGKHSVDGLTVDFETITNVRSGLIPIERLIRRNIGVGNSVEKSFYGVIPPIVTSGDITVGCGKLPDPTCIQTYEFTKEITKERILDAIDDACDWVHMSPELKQSLIADTIAGINLHELKNVINYYINGAVPSGLADDTSLSPRQRINSQIRQAEKYLIEKMGDYAPERNTFVVYVSADLMNECQNDDLGARSYDMVTLDPMINVFGVDAIISLNERFLNPADGEIYITFPTLSFEMIKCKNELTVTLLNETGRKLNTPRMFYYENYEFATLEFPLEVDGEMTVVQLQPAVKAGATTPAV